MNGIVLRLLVCCALVVLAVPLPASAESLAAFDAGQARAVDALVEAVMAKERVPGISVVVASGKRVLFAKGYGCRDCDDALPATPETIYELGSLTKQLTAAGLMLLVEQRRVGLDDPVVRYVPAIRRADITVRRLLTHTSGIPDYTKLPDFDRARDTTPDAIVRSVADLPLTSPPGTRLEYSNTNYVLVGMIIERVSGEPYARFMQEHVFAPLGMTNTSYVDRASVRGGRALGYDRRDDGTIVHAPYSSPTWPFAAGGVSSTARDFVLWDNALVSSDLLSAPALAAMTTSGTLLDGRATGYGFGINVANTRMGRLYFHLGRVPGFSSWNGVFPDAPLSVIVLTNSWPFDPTTLGMAIARVGLGSTAQDR